MERTKQRQDTKTKTKQWYLENRERKNQAYKLWRRRNREKLNAIRRQKHSELMKTDPLYRAKQALRACVSFALKRIKKGKECNTEKLLGGSFEQVKNHIENLFHEGMSWSNHGLWHIDHIRPVSSFTEKDIHLMNHYTNLQPLWAKDNLSKSDKF